MQLDDTIFSSHFLELLITIFTSFIASSGFWFYITKKSDVKDGNRRLLLGLAHDRIVYLCGKFIEKGYITQDEYENLHTFLYQPYIEIGGNGTAKRLMDEINKLDIVNNRSTHVSK